MKKDITFEDALKRLEEIVKALESGNTPLEDSIKLFEEGVQLSAYCNKLLESAEQKVTMLIKGDGEDMKETPYIGEESN